MNNMLNELKKLQYRWYEITFDFTKIISFYEARYDQPNVITRSEESIDHVANEYDCDVKDINELYKYISDIRHGFRSPLSRTYIYDNRETV